MDGSHMKHSESAKELKTVEEKVMFMKKKFI